MTEQVPTTCVRCAVGCGHVQQAVDRGYGLDLVRFAEGAVFAQVPAMFPERSGTAAGVVGGVGTCGGIAFPLVLSGAAGRFGFHDGYLAVAALTLPALAVAAWVFRPAVAARANVAGLTGDPSSGFPEASDD